MLQDAGLNHKFSNLFGEQSSRGNEKQKISENNFCQKQSLKDYSFVE